MQVFFLTSTLVQVNKGKTYYQTQSAIEASANRARHPKLKLAEAYCTTVPKLQRSLSSYAVASMTKSFFKRMGARQL